MAGSKKDRFAKKREAVVKARIEESKEKLIKALEQHPIIRSACARAGLGKDFYYDHRKADPVFRARTASALEEGREFMADIAESQLFKKVKEGDKTAIIFTLKNLRKNVYNDRVVHEHQGDPLTPERLMQIVEAARNWNMIDSDFLEPTDSDLQGP